LWVMSDLSVDILIDSESHKLGKLTDWFVGTEQGCDNHNEVKGWFITSLKALIYDLEKEIDNEQSPE